MWGSNPPCPTTLEENAISRKNELPDNLVDKAGVSILGEVES